MRIYIYTLLFCSSISSLAYGQMGVGTDNPSHQLHVVGDVSQPALRLQNVRAGSGDFLTITPDGVIKKAPFKFDLSFVVPAAVHQVGENGNGSISLSASNQAGSGVTFADGESANVMISGRRKWTAITGLRRGIKLTESTNTISFLTEGLVHLERVVQTNSTTPSVGISYAIGVFLDDRLVASRVFILYSQGGNNSTPTSHPFHKWEVLGQINDVSAGDHTISVYVTRLETRPSSVSTNSLYVCSPAPVTPESNRNVSPFSSKGILQIRGVYR